MIRLFGEVPLAPVSRLHIPVKWVVGNVAAAALCAALALLWFGVAFAAGDSPHPDESMTVTLFLWSIAVAVGILGAGLGSVLRHFPWLVILLTPILLGVIMRLPGDRDGFSMGLKLGSYASGVSLSAD